MRMSPYSPEVEEMMKKTYDSMAENTRRIFLATEVSKLGYGGQVYICKLFSCSPNTIKRGLYELENGMNLPAGRIRQRGGGRKKSKLESRKNENR